jgi:hypothetical protein
MKSGNRELVDRLAAEYVLGTLRGRARRHFERWLVSPQVDQMVKSWEGRLAGLEPPLERIAPPPTVWRGIEQRLDLRKYARLPATRWLAIAASILLLAIVGVFAIRGTLGPALPATQIASIQENASATHAQTIYWRVELLGDNQELAVRVALRQNRQHRLVKAALQVSPTMEEQHPRLQPRQARQTAPVLDDDGSVGAGRCSYVRSIVKHLLRGHARPKGQRGAAGPCAGRRRPHRCLHTRIALATACERVSLLVAAPPAAITLPISPRISNLARGRRTSSTRRSRTTCGRRSTRH